MFRYLIFAALAVIIALYINTGRLLLNWVRLLVKSINPVVFWVIYGVVVTTVIVLFIVSEIVDLSQVPWLAKISQYALGYSMYLLLTVNFMGLVVLGIRLMRLQAFRNIHMASGFVSIALVCFFCIYGTINGASVKTVEYNVHIPDLELNIVLISDIHLGYIVDEVRLEAIVEEVNRQNPDIVCIAGDLVDGDTQIFGNPERLKELFNSIQSKYGVYACLGNHDAGSDFDNIMAFFEDTQVTILLDEGVVIDERFEIVGRRDSSPIGGQGDKRTPISTPDSGYPRIILDHQPSNIDEYTRATDLILCGHTHKGQMFPFNFITNAIFTVDYGYYRANEQSPQVIVSSGVGTWGPPLRVGSHCEVVVIKIK